MKLRFTTCCFILILLGTSALAQVVTATPVAVNQNGTPLPSTTVTVCNVNPLSGSCGSLVTTFTDITLSTPCTGVSQPLNNQQNPSVSSGCSNPGIVDSLGNVVAYAVVGIYWCQYSGPLITTQSFPCTSSGTPPQQVGAPLNAIQFNCNGLFCGDPAFTYISGTKTANWSGLNVSLGGPVQFAPHGALSTPPPVNSSVDIDSSGNLYLSLLGAAYNKICTFVTCISTTGNGAGQVGDTLRFNVNGDGNYDAVNAAFKIVVAFANYAQGDIESYGATKQATSPSVNSTTHSILAPTATDSGAYTLSAAASASTNTVLGVREGANPNFGGYGFGAFYRWTLRFAAGGSTNVRYWFGLTSYNTSGGGTEGSDPYGTTSFATNTPNRSTIAFRYSAGTDTTWKATTQVTSGSQTVVDTTIAVDTNPHNFEFTYDGTTVRFYIDAVLKASITTNIPAANASAAQQFVVADNQNTNNAVSGTFYHMFLALK